MFVKNIILFLFFILILFISCNRQNVKTEINSIGNNDNNTQLNLIQPQETISSLTVNGHLFVLDKTIERNELWDLSQAELRILRNSIFARYGFVFKSEDLKNYFAQFHWYNAKNDNVDNYLTEADRENISRIQQIEDSLAKIAQFQNEVIEWIQSEEISPHSDVANINGMNLFQNPVLYPETPKKLTEYLDVDLPNHITNFCYAMGRFLAKEETDIVLQKISHKEIEHAIVFNPSVLFLNQGMFGRIYKPYKETGVFLLVFPKDSSSAYNIQSNQVSNNSAKNILIMPWSVKYLLYKITDSDEFNLVDTVVAN